MTKCIPGYENAYTIDDTGQVYSLRRKRYCRPSKMSNGYLYVHLCNGPMHSKYMRVHRLVAEAFLDNPNAYSQVNHINGNKLDNRLENLEWCSATENMAHAQRMGLWNTKGENNPSAKLTNIQVDEIRRMYVRGSKEFGTYALGQAYGVSNVMISKIVRGECWKIENDRSVNRDV